MRNASSHDRRQVIPAPASYVRFLLRRFGDTPERRSALLAGTDIDERRLDEAGAEVTLFTFIILAENLCRVIGESWPLEALPAWSTAMQGALEVAARSARTVGESLEIIARFGHVRGPFLALRLQQERRAIRLVVQANVAMSEEAWHSLSATVLLGVVAVLDVLLEGATSTLKYTFPWPAPAYVAQLRAALPGELRFNQPQCAIIVPETLCKRRSVFADATLHVAAVGELEQASRRILGHDTFVLRVERLLKRHRQGRLSEPAAARELGLSTRTMVRRLAEAGTTYRRLFNVHLKLRAQKLINEGKHSREEMAELLGFEDATSFSRARRRWFGNRTSKTD